MSESCLESWREINGMSSADTDLVGRRPTFGALSVKALGVRSKVEFRSGSFDSDSGGSGANVDRVSKVALDGSGCGDEEANDINGIGANDDRCGSRSAAIGAGRSRSAEEKDVVNDSGVVGSITVVLDTGLDLNGEHAGSRNGPGAAGEVDPDFIEDADAGANNETGIDSRDGDPDSATNHGDDFGIVVASEYVAPEYVVALASLRNDTGAIGEADPDVVEGADVGGNNGTGFEARDGDADSATNHCADFGITEPDGDADSVINHGAGFGIVVPDKVPAPEYVVILASLKDL